MSLNKDQFYSWLQTVLKDKGWQIARSGTKVSDLSGKHNIDNRTGFWSDPNYSGSKPPRWIINFSEENGTLEASVPSDHRASRIGQGNTAQGNAVGLSVRIVPVFKASDDSYVYYESWEWLILFLMPYPVPVGSSSETFDYDAIKGTLTYQDKKIDYIFSALLGLFDPTETVDINGLNVSYQQATDALKSLLHTNSMEGQIKNIPYFNLFTEGADDLAELKRTLQIALTEAPQPAKGANKNEVDDEAEPASDEPEELLPEIEENKDLLGIDPVVYRQINAALQSGKQHLMLYGPPGTGKTTLARWVASQLSGTKWNLITGSSDWSSQDIIGGYQPVGNAEVAFMPGILLKTFDQPLIIDELNRCDIDKVLGPLFTVLSGHYTTLPYRTKVSDPNSPAYTILPTPKSGVMDHEFAPGLRWRLIATINSIDKASLYQMSYALSRRFAWIYVDSPDNNEKFLSDFLKDVVGHTYYEGPNCPLALIWDSINQVRVLGPAPFIDMIRAILAIDKSANFFIEPSLEMRKYLLDTFDMFLLPLLDGILRYDAEKIVDDMIQHLSISDGKLKNRISDRLLSIAV